MGRTREITIDGFHNRYVPEPMSGCWLWLEHTQRGYGLTHWYFGKKRLTVQAHRLAYMLLRGPIPADLQLDHKCRVRCCVNPAHLEPVTGLVNRRRAMPDRCKHGHIYTIATTAYKATGARVCRICSRAKSKRWKQRQYSRL